MLGGEYGVLGYGESWPREMQDAVGNMDMHAGILFVLHNLFLARLTPKHERDRASKCHWVKYQDMRCNAVEMSTLSAQDDRSIGQRKQDSPFSSHHCPPISPRSAGVDGSFGFAFALLGWEGLRHETSKMLAEPSALIGELYGTMCLHRAWASSDSVSEA